MNESKKQKAKSTNGGFIKNSDSAPLSKGELKGDLDSTLPTGQAGSRPDNESLLEMPYEALLDMPAGIPPLAGMTGKQKVVCCMSDGEHQE